MFWGLPFPRHGTRADAARRGEQLSLWDVRRAAPLKLPTLDGSRCAAPPYLDRPPVPTARVDEARRGEKLNLWGVRRAAPSKLRGEQRSAVPAPRRHLKTDFTGAPIRISAVDDYSCDSRDPHLPNASDPTFWPRDSIFFHETSCRRASDRHLNPRQACAVESAARANPKRNVFVLFSSRQNHSGELTHILQKYENVNFARLYMDSYAVGTPLEEWLKSGQLEKSSYRTSHTSDVLRFLTLWKFGGIYLDLDVVVARSLEDLGLNWGGFEMAQSAGSSVLGISQDEVGRLFTDAALRELTTNFNGDRWTHNGPDLIARVMKSLCSDKKFPGMMPEERCKGFRMFPPEYFNPIYYSKWKDYFEPQGMDKLSHFQKVTYVYHVWNKLSSDFRTDSTVQVPYTYLAEQYCPKIYAITKDNFYALRH